MSAQETAGFPDFPDPPTGDSPLDYLPSVAARIRYWEAVRLRAIAEHDPGLERTASGLRASYMAARSTKLEMSDQRNGAGGGETPSGAIGRNREASGPLKFTYSAGPPDRLPVKRRRLAGPR